MRSAKPPEVEFFDATLFLGMNSDQETVRIACKNFFASRMDGELSTSLDQVGACDDVIWRYARQQQDRYYPFMDVLHSIVVIHRRPYSDTELQRAAQSEDFAGLNASQRLLCSKVSSAGGRLYTLCPHLLARRNLAVSAPPSGDELSFPPSLETLYQASLALRVPLTALSA
ncbi:hypothetical protein DIE11_17175 [Burkholderia sp. Bp9012]|uniref:DUF6190 family protein n=1 Tax=Burkholderia sp. Bp9012 TaxID=2184562 RepID=UPI000F5A983B|nr:DUF6190 family protein [Burkholderia sp. Bp9012]RQR79134.1 hypothetical protein DIE11_17175 [Burkholderia sp. Bp9012]